jgi:HEPN/Toprim N-terminal domain 1
VDILHPYSVLRLLAEANEDASVVWQYGPLVQGGYATEREFVPHARRTGTFLIATEGSSDVHVLKHALALLRPGIADFFRFIDVSESHPFSGTGNLVKFAEGLAKIDVQNQVVFVFDNDAEGLDAHQRLSTLTLPANMRRIMLPELEAFRAFPAEGPEGLRTSDINRRAAAIECYLDLNVGGHPPAKVLWTNYKKGLGIYQGALEYKESYIKEFLKQTPETLSDGSYDVRKIEAVLDLLIAECTAIAVDQWDPADVELRDAF